MAMATCDLCGVRSYDVKPAVVRWEGGEYEAVNRCTDHVKCQGRVFAAQRPWRVSGGRT